MTIERKNPTRRDFMKHTGAAAAAAAVTGPFIRTARAAKNDKLKVGLIGCGGRGTGAARQALLADPDTELVALGDAFRDKVNSSYDKLKNSNLGDRINVGPEHRFVGFDAYKHVIASCDVVVMASPPHFRPMHLAAAVASGKHVFCEKPIAVDPVGVRAVMATCEKAKEKRLNVVSGLCYRYQFAKQDTIQQIHDGAVGDILALQTTYNTGQLWHRGQNPEWSEMEYQIRNWIYFDWLSGDHIVEQHIHSLDKIAWAMGDQYPVRATASGGRVQRDEPKFGNVYDHFNTVYEFPGDIKCFSSCRQWDNASTDVSDHVFGTKGTAHIQTHHIEFHDGKDWRHKQTGPDDMYQNEHNALFAAIRNDEPINNGDYMCKSTMMAILGRLSAYTGKTLEWDTVLNSDFKLGPDDYAWTEYDANPVAEPGYYPVEFG